MSDNNPIIQRVVEYLTKNLEKGYDLDALKIALMKQGYARSNVQRAIEIIEERKSSKLKAEKARISYELYDKDDKILFRDEKKPFWKRLFD
jgi:hypothetical protein